MREKGARVANEIDETKTKNEQKKLNNLVCQDFFHNMWSLSMHKKQLKNITAI